MGCKVSTIAVSGTTSVCCATVTTMPSSTASVSGRLMVNVEPFRGANSIAMRPPKAWIERLTTSMPTPRPEMSETSCAVAQQTLVVPLTAIVETWSRKRPMCMAWAAMRGSSPSATNSRRLIDVGRELSYRTTPADPLASVALLVETEGGGRSALLVDAIQGQRQVVIKSWRPITGTSTASPPRRFSATAASRSLSMWMRSLRIRMPRRTRKTIFGRGGVTAMTEQGSSAMNGRELIAFRIGAQEFCVDIMAVREIRGFTPATPLPQSPAFVRGVINLRGAVLPIIDLSARLGFPPAEPTARHVIMVVQIGKQTVGLLVDAVSDILTVAAESMQPTPDVASEMAKNFVRGVIAIDGRMISLIALDNVLPAMESEARMKPVRTSDVESDEAQGLASGEFLMTPEDFRQIADDASCRRRHSSAGNEGDARLFAAHQAAARAWAEELPRLLRSRSERGGADERQQMLAALTTNVTRFFREPHHFEHLRKRVLPPHRGREARRPCSHLVGRLSNGEEPYSIALTLLSAFANRHLMRRQDSGHRYRSAHDRRGERGTL